MRNTWLLVSWVISAISLFLILIYAGEYSEKECIKNGGSWEQFTWSKGCRK